MVVTLSLLLPAAGCMRTLQLSLVALENSWSLRESTEALSDATKPNTLKNGLLTDAYRNARTGVVLSGNLSRIWTSDDDTRDSTIEVPKKLGFLANYFVTLQWSEVPREISGFEMILDRYRRNSVYWGRLRILDFTPGYGFALYSKSNKLTDVAEVAGKP